MSKNVNKYMLERACPTLKVHESDMVKVQSDKYLGDVLSSEYLNKMNIDAKCSKGMGMITQIMMLLEEVGFGPFYFETAILLREAVFVNGLLFNVEVNYGLTKEDINRLELLDRVLLKKIFGCHSRTASELLFLEPGCVPLNMIVVSRRVNFLHYMLCRPENDLLKKFLKFK